ncbi:DUF4303 domain-containing protein [Ruania alkalisoli]|uniref:DUF4303 domain-containing protein n=1 Tax=Ruania alkalisoli TaxID=2779775 RepID=A0A7M1SRU6_9MICO|nr:DUF4303 domain-containing protein [Ruania alkalisoli]QOR69867.1 DUF4303 domain-containing protein [Ruania alkalisoli]
MTVVSEPIPALVDAIAEATDEAIRRLRSEHRADFCVYALVTSGEAYRPYLTATVHGESRWDLADSPYALVADEILARTDVAFTARGQLQDMDAAKAEEEYWRRLTSMEAALRRLDEAGIFGTGIERDRVLLLVATMPPDENDAGFARSLNPGGPLLDAWLAEAAEGA